MHPQASSSSAKAEDPRVWFGWTPDLAAGPAAALDLVDALQSEPAMKNYHLLPRDCLERTNVVQCFR
jgi:hypothetical protein